MADFPCLPPRFFTVSVYLIFFNLALFCSGVLSVHDPAAIGLPVHVDTAPGRRGDEGSPCSGTTKPASCPVKCFRPDPVCGVDGVTYWCGCSDALCSGAQVSKSGFCEVGNGGSASFSGQALLLLHIVWLILLGVLVLFGFF